MRSEELLDLLNQVEQPSEILIRLHEKNFAVTDLTEDGDTVLHVLAKSNHAKDYFAFSNYIEVLLQAGADVNVLDKQGNSFLSYYLEHESFFLDKTLNLLFAHKDFNPQQILKADQTFFEFIYQSLSYWAEDAFKSLIEHQKFNPNQKTSRHNSILLHMIWENLYSRKKYLYDVINNIKTNPNIKNTNGQTALAYILSNPKYRDMELISQLINHEQFEVNTLDNDGNNYLQLAIIHYEFSCETIATLLISKGIDILHKNNDDKSIIDLLYENEAGRSSYTNMALLLEILKAQPALFFEKNANGKIILSDLLKSSAYHVTSQFKELLELCKNQPENRELLKKIISDCFNDFLQNNVSEYTLRLLVKALLEATIDIDVEYCLAIIAVYESSSERDELYANIKQLNPNFDLSEVIRHIKNLTKENNSEQLQALDYVGETRFDLNCFDDTMLAWEEKYLQAKVSSGLTTDCSLFGHLFSLSGSVPINNQLIKLTGNTFSNTAPFIVHLLNAYAKHCEQNGKYPDYLDSIKHVRNMTIKAMRFYFLSIPWGDYYGQARPSKDSLLSSILADSTNLGAEIVTGWPEHAIDLIIQQDNFYRNNGGGCSTDATTEHYKMSKAQNLTKEIIAKLYNETSQESNKTYIQRDLHNILGLIFDSTVDGKFQTVGNCSLASLLIALKVKYRLVLPEAIADELYADTIAFFEQFYLEEFLSRYADNPTLPHLLMRLIIQKLLPEGKLELIEQLLKNHFTSDTNQEIMQAEFMIHQWQQHIKGNSTEQLDKQLQSLRIVLNPSISHRLVILDQFLANAVTDGALNELSSWPLNEQTFQGYHLLHFAVMNNNLTLASSLIQMFPEAINQSNWFEQEPLCLVKSVEMIELLVKAGASTTRTKYDNALDCAILADRLDLVEALLKHNAKPSEYSASYAARKDPKILQALIETYPEIVTKPTYNYSTAIHAAARNGHNTNLRNLIYYGGANPGACDVNGITPLQLALKYKHPDTAKLLIKYPGTLFKRPYRGDSVVSMATSDKLKQLIACKKKERKSDLAYFERFKESNPGIVKENVDYLIIAIRNNDLPAIRGCLIAYPEIKVVNYSKHYCSAPLTEAIRRLAGKTGQAYKDNFAIIKMLLNTPSIDINALMATSEPILFMATSIGDVAVLELFLADPKLNPNQQDNVGYTALHDAVERGHLGCVKRLLQDERVDSTLVNNANETVLDLKSFKYGVRECQEEVTRYQERMHLNRSKLTFSC
ncbi:Ankyrin repeat protein [Legionella beliardensis]|uniref:Ankyrin repeat protein n=1 Tax=Legionella beliardensis TaxID=91822 RepID=A0A378I012_9GAMM|nr:ankyrin repeat domain-containing protein [Legionella beliardensis]STX27896.1 Ankyrin repeat protein [Legionella beliardensis]